MIIWFDNGELVIGILEQSSLDGRVGMTAYSPGVKM